MYTVLGANGREYGPVPAEIIRRWIGERRLEGRSRVRREGEADWRGLSECPEFAADLAAGAVHVPPVPATRPPVFPSATPTPAALRGAAPVSAGSESERSGLASQSGASQPGTAAAATLGGGRVTSGLAIASLVLGILAPCTAGALGLPGAILGFMALRAIRRSDGRIAGRGMARTGLALSLVFLVVGPGLVISAIVARHRAEAQYAQYGTLNECVQHLEELAQGMRRHANDNNDQFPPAATWCDAIQSEVNGLNVFQCQARPALRSAYAINVAVAGKTRFEVAPNTVLLFESDVGWNGAGDVAAMITVSRHAGVFNVVLADGSVQQVSMDGLAGLRWNP